MQCQSTLSKPLAHEKLLEALSEDHFVPKPSSTQREGVAKNESVEFEENGVY